MAKRPLLDPQALGKVSRMELIARQVVEGFVSGKHPSPFHGASVEYADHRPYTLGDEIRTLDWKLLAKTDKYYVKLFEDETNLRATVMVDASRSMATRSEGDDKLPTKLEYACYLAAAIGYLMLKQNDSVGLAVLDNHVREYLPARSTPAHFRRMIDVLETVQPERDTALGPVLHELAGRMQRRGMVILISDLLDDRDSLMDGLSHFRHDRHEVIVMHVMDPAELTFPFDRLTRFKDMEGAGSLLANPRNIRAKYLQRLEVFMRDVKAQCLQRGISYQFTRTDTPFEQMLMAYLSQRMRTKRRKTR